MVFFYYHSFVEPQVKTTENHTRECHKVQNNNNILGVPVSPEELKIRSDIEMEIEKDLEEEIKESIYHLALRLHRIYKQRKERNNAKEASEYGNQLDNRRSTRALSEVNISIRMEGGTKVEIKEVNKEVAKRGCPRSPYRTQNVKEVNAFGAKNKKFDWVKTLRAGSSPVVAVNRSNFSSKSKHNTDPNYVFSNCKLDRARGKNVGSPWQAKRGASGDKKLLQLGWKV